MPGITRPENVDFLFNQILSIKGVRSVSLGKLNATIKNQKTSYVAYSYHHDARPVQGNGDSASEALRAVLIRLHSVWDFKESDLKKGEES